MLFPQAASPHLQPPTAVAVLMRRVLYALAPGAIAYSYFFGWGVLFNIVVAATTALATEALMLRLRGRPLGPSLGDYSALVSAVLLALALPPLAPWWLTFISTAFAIVIAKHLYGGLGYNPFNPAMVGYVVALVSFPKDMVLWLTPPVQLGLLETINMQLTGLGPSGVHADVLTGATPLDALKIDLGRHLTISELSLPGAAHGIFGTFGAHSWEWINLAFLAGGVGLWLSGVIRWHIPVAMLGSLALIALIFHISDADLYASPWFHVFGGGAMLGAFFIATDPVTASTTTRGRLVYAAGIGILTYVIRTWGGYPDGIAFAVLLMNMAVPTIDYYTQPRVFGQHGR